MPQNTTPHHRRPHRDPRAPFVLDVRELGRQPGSIRPVRRCVPAPAGFGLDVIRVPEGAPLALELRMESVTEGVLVTGTVTTSVVGECGRCLEPVSDEFTVDVMELFAYPDSSTDATTGQDEVERIEDDYIDLEPTVRDAVVLGLPVTPLCRPDCAGLCPECGQRLDDLPPGHEHGVIDPRWAALADRGGHTSSTDDRSSPSKE
ncbi:MAG: DUF177 domain-containing protein [Actinobacteria bacterium]|nr:DUF177 domain-containing protein [Actinomycetota bacterium]